MSPYTGVILAAGKGTRMKSKKAKVLHKICGIEMVRLTADTLLYSGLDPVIVVVPSDSNEITQVLGDKFIYVTQNQQLGSGHALLQTQTSINGTPSLFVINADVPLITPQSIQNMLQTHSSTSACITLLTATVNNPTGLGRILRSSEGDVVRIQEDLEFNDRSVTPDEINVGGYCFETSWLWDNLKTVSPSPNGEVFLTDLVRIAVQQGMLVQTVSTEKEGEAIGINSRIQLSAAERVLRQRVRENWLLKGVTMPDPETVYIDMDVVLGNDTILHPNTHVSGASTIGSDCQIGPNSTIVKSVVGSGCRIVESLVENSTLGNRVAIGPYSRVRANSKLHDDVYIGTHTEIKNSVLGNLSKSSHFSYIGDADIGSNVNIGAGTVTCNYDGVNKNRTVIQDDAFIGSSSMLIAPINIGPRAVTGAGSVVTKNVPADFQAVGVPARSSRRNLK